MKEWINGPTVPDVAKEYVLSDLIFVHKDSPEFSDHFDEFIEQFGERLYNTFADEDLLDAIRETEDSPRDRLIKLKLVIGRFRAFSRALCGRLTPADQLLLAQDKGATELIGAAGYDLTSLVGECLAHWYVEIGDPMAVNPPKEHTTVPGIDFMEFFDCEGQHSVRVWETKTISEKQMAPHCTKVNSFFVTTIYNTLQDTFKTVRRQLPQAQRAIFRPHKDFLPGGNRFHYGAFFVTSHITERSPYLAYKQLEAPSLRHRHMVILAFPDNDFAQLSKAVGRVGDEVCTRILRDLA